MPFLFIRHINSRLFLKLDTFRWAKYFNLDINWRHLLNLSIKSTNLLILFIGSTFVTNWWRFTEWNAPQMMFSTWTPAAPTSSVVISSSTSGMPLSKTTSTWVRSVLCRLAVCLHRSKGDVLSPACPSGRFTQAILQPVLGKRSSAANGGMDSVAGSGEPGWVFQRGEKNIPTFWCFSVQLFLFWLQNLCRFQWNGAWQTAGQKAAPGGARPHFPAGEEQRRSKLSLCGSR